MRSWGSAGILLTLVSLLCWVVMFLAGTDVWHDTGSHDFWHLQGPPYTDLRAFAYAFYSLFVALIGILAVQVASAVRGRGRVTRRPRRSDGPGRRPKTSAAAVGPRPSVPHP